MNSFFKAVRISYAKAPSDTRESLSLNETASKKLLAYLTREIGLTNVLVLSASTFIEVYYSASADMKPVIVNALVKQKQTASQENIPFLTDESYTITTTSDQTMQHLFRVSATPESMGPGGDNMYKLLKKRMNSPCRKK